VHCADLEAFAAAERWLLALRGNGSSAGSSSGGSSGSGSGSGRDEVSGMGSDDVTAPAPAPAPTARLMSQVTAEATCVGYLHSRLARRAAARSGTSVLALAHALVRHEGDHGQGQGQGQGLGGPSASTSAFSTSAFAASAPSRTLETLLLPLTLFVSQSGQSAHR
jgi:hypothetical protein